MGVFENDAFVWAKASCDDPELNSQMMICETPFPLMERIGCYAQPDEEIGSAAMAIDPAEPDPASACYKTCPMTSSFFTYHRTFRTCQCLDDRPLGGLLEEDVCVMAAVNASSVPNDGYGRTDLFRKWGPVTCERPMDLLFDYLYVYKSDGFPYVGLKAYYKCIPGFEIDLDKIDLVRKVISHNRFKLAAYFWPLQTQLSDEDLKLLDEQTQAVICQSDGEWEYPVACIPGKCPMAAPDAPPDAQMNVKFKNPYPWETLDHYGSRVFYQCPVDGVPKAYADNATFEFGLNSIQTHGRVHNFTVFCDIDW